MHSNPSSEVCCVVVNFFSAGLTIEAVDSFITQYPQGEIVVVDNSADPQEAQHLRLGLHPKVKLLTTTGNIGFARACNKAFELSNRPFVLLLNPDAQLQPDCVHHLVEALHKHQNLGAVSPLQFWDKRLEWFLPSAWYPTGIGQWALAKGLRSARAAQRLSQAYRARSLSLWRSESSTVVPQKALSGGAMMIRRAAVAQFDRLFDPEYFMYFEDSDLCLRLQRAGWQLAIARQAKVVHEWANSPGKAELMSASQAYYFSKNFAGQGQWEIRLQQALSIGPLTNPLQAQEFSWGHQKLPVPNALKDGWLFEVSPSSLMIPSIASFGYGPAVTIDWKLMRRLAGTGAFFIRIGSPVQSCGLSHVYKVRPPDNSQAIDPSRNF